MITETIEQVISSGFRVEAKFKGGAVMNVVRFEDGRAIGKFCEGTIDQIVSEDLSSCPAECIKSFTIIV